MSTKKDFPVSQIRRFLEPGPVVLVSSLWKNKMDIMTMGWHTIMGEEPSLIGCYIWDKNYSQKLILKSGECVINVPETKLIDTAVAIGNTSGKEIDKFAEFELTAKKGKKVSAPMIDECFANFECKVFDHRMVKKYNFFILEVVKAHVKPTPKYPKTFHYTGDGIFMFSGIHQNLSKNFNPEML